MIRADSSRPETISHVRQRGFLRIEPAEKASIEAEIARIREQTKALDSEVCTMEALVAQTEREVINFGESWKQEKRGASGRFKVRYFLKGWSTTKNTCF